MLILVRHGKYDHRYHLSDAGRKDIERLASALESTINGQQVALLTSTAARAIESAEVLGGRLGIEAQLHDLLWSEATRPPDLHGALELIRSQNGAEVVILVTHFEYVEEFPSFFAKEALGGAEGFPYREIPKGAAWIIDCEAKTCTFLDGREN